MRLSYAVDDIPEKLGLKSTVSVLDYNRVPVGDSTFLLPQGSELRMVDSGGVENRNRTIFHGCRQLTGQSVIKFGSPPTDAAAPSARPPDIALPDEFLVEIVLDTPIDSESVAIGDPIRAVLKQFVDHAPLPIRDEEPLPTMRYGDIALCATPSQDGTGIRVQVTQRQPDGSWLRIIDRPESHPAADR